MSSRYQSTCSSVDWKRARRDETDLANRRIWESRDKTYRIIESVGKFIEMGTHWYAILVESQRILYVGRSERQAYVAVERHHNPPKRSKRKRQK